MDLYDYMNQEEIYEEFHFHIHCSDDMALLKDLERYYAQNHREVRQEYGQFSAYLRGKQEYGGVTFYVTPPQHHSATIYSFRNRDEYQQLMSLISEKERQQDEKLDKQYSMYRFNHEGKYQRKEAYRPRHKQTLFGLETPFEDVMTQLTAHQDHRSFLTSIGEDGRSINYLLYGPPGTGKSSFVTSIATALKYPIYIVNPTTVAPEQLQAALSPNGANAKILLCEDVDRYLIASQPGQSSVSSQLLNSLAGMDDNSNVIRFFTANEEQVLKSIPALASRFTATYYFALPTKEMLCTKVDLVMQYYGRDWQQRMNRCNEMEKLCERAVQYRLSFRDLTNYVIRFLFPPLGSSAHKDYQPLKRCLDEKEWKQMMNMHTPQASITQTDHSFDQSNTNGTKRRHDSVETSDDGNDVPIVPDDDSEDDDYNEDVSTSSSACL